MDEREKYSTSALKLEQIPHVEATTEHLKANLNSSAPCARPPRVQRAFGKLKLDRAKTYTFLSAGHWDHKQTEVWESAQLSVWAHSKWKTVLDISYLGAHRVINCFLWVSLQTNPWEIYEAQRNDDDSVLRASGKSPEC